MIKQPLVKLDTVSLGAAPSDGSMASLPKIKTTTKPYVATFAAEELEKDYRYGGYHPVRINDRLGPNKNYRVIRKLGWGQFSTVWLALDSRTGCYHALKIVKSDKNYTDAAMDEIAILQRVQDKHEKCPDHAGYKYILKLHDWFKHKGPNGEHVVMALEVLGENLLNLLTTFHKKESRKELSLDQFGKTYGGLPLNVVKKITKQCCLAMDYLHRVCGIIHTDIKPENILIEIKDVERFLSFLDFSAEVDDKQEERSTPVTSSNPLPSPLVSRGSNLFFDASQSPKAKRNSVEKSLHSNSNDSMRSSVSYYGNYTTEAPSSSASISPTLLPMVRNPSSLHHCCTVTTSEANSDEDDDDDAEDEDNDDDEETNYGKYFELPKSFHFKENLDDDELQVLESMINIKIADLGNACFHHYHFTNSIQTRQYRAPEIIMRSEKWGCSADIWSLACLVFELITGDFLFDPHSSNKYDKDDDHLALILELLHPDDDELHGFLDVCYKHMNYFFRATPDDRYESGERISLHKIPNLKFWTLEKVLMQKYHMERELAYDITDFLLPMLRLVPKQRVDLGGWSNHPWLSEGLRKDLSEEIGSVNVPCGSHGENVKGWHKLSRHR